MTWHDKYLKNQNLITNYFMWLNYESLPKEDALKLITEIGRLRLQNQWIDKMSILEYRSKIKHTPIVLLSRI